MASDVPTFDCPSSKAKHTGSRLVGRLKRASMWGQPKTDPAMQEIETICHNVLNLPASIVELTKSMYSDVKQRRGPSLRGDFKKAVMACCTIHASKLPQMEVCCAFEILPKALTSATKMVRLELYGKPYYKKAFSGLTPRDVIARHLTHGVDRRTRSRILREAAKLEAVITEAGVFEGRSPGTLAAGILKIVLGDDIDFTQAASACGTSVHTAQTIYKELAPIARRGTPNLSLAMRADSCSA